jgi:hypothetical protein
MPGRGQRPPDELLPRLPGRSEDAHSGLDVMPPGLVDAGILPAQVTVGLPVQRAL